MIGGDGTCGDDVVTVSVEDYVLVLCRERSGWSDTIRSTTDAYVSFKSNFDGVTSSGFALTYRMVPCEYCSENLSRLASQYLMSGGL